MYDFTYHKPATLADAASLLAGADDGSLLAGGHTLLPTLKQRLAQPSDLIDVTGVGELQGIRRDGDTLIIGAAATHAEVASSAEVQGAIPALAALAGGIGDAQVRHRGTIGGSIANNDPAADYPAGLVGLGATIKTDKREIAADDFFTGLFETSLEASEIITEVRFPVPAKAGYAKFANPASRYAIVGVMVSAGPAGTRAAVTGAGPCVFRAGALEAALGDGLAADGLADAKIDAGGLNTDMHASAEYRAHLIGVIAARAAAAAA